MRVMIDSNILDRLDADDEALDELSNRRDILVLVTPAQEREVAAIPDPAKRERLQGIMELLCRRLAVPSRIPVQGWFPSSGMDRSSGLVESLPAGSGMERSGQGGAIFRAGPGNPADELIIAAAVAAGCDLLVSEDIEVLNKALATGIRAMDWKLFLGRVVWAPRRGQK